MANTYTLISSVTVGAGGASSIAFSSIPATYTDLKLVLSARTDRSAVNNNCFLTINSSSAADYSDRYLQGSGSAASSSSDSAATSVYVGGVPGASATSSTFSNIEIYITNYAGSNNKSFSADTVAENNATAATSNLIAGLWAKTNAVTSLSIDAATFNFVQYSTAYLYGIKNS
jgi:hypothetical protein